MELLLLLLFTSIHRIFAGPGGRAV